MYITRHGGGPLALALVEPLLAVAAGAAAPGAEERVGQSLQQRISFHAKVTGRYVIFQYII